MNPTLRSLLQLNRLDQQQHRANDRKSQTGPLPKTVLKAPAAAPPQPQPELPVEPQPS